MQPEPDVLRIADDAAVSEQLAGREDMLDPELVAKAIKGRPNTLKRDADSTNGGEYVALSETDEPP